MIKIAPSILTWDFTEIGRTLKIIEKSGVNMLHLDVMDGHFVPNITFGPAMVKSIRKKTGLILDVHLMIEEPEKYISIFKEAGADIVTVHVETVSKLNSIIRLIRKEGLRVGVSLNPKTSLNTIKKYLPEIDMVLLMTVNPGFGGQEFIKSMLPKIRELRKAVLRKGLKLDIEVDGGINLETAPMAVKAGANIVVAGNYLYKARNMLNTVISLNNAINNIKM